MGLNGELGGGINGPGESQGYIEAYKGASNTRQLHHPLLNLMPPTHTLLLRSRWLLTSRLALWNP